MKNVVLTAVLVASLITFAGCGAKPKEQPSPPP